MSANPTRQSEVSRLRAQLQLSGFPRLQMLLIVALTGGAGFLASFVMLRCCVASMAVRYPAAVGFAYLLFLFLLWLWLRTTAEDYAEIPDPSGIPTPRGAGADCPPELPAPADDGGAVSEVLGGLAHAEELALPLLLLLAVAALALSALWIVYSAPTLFAELLIDGALSASLYRRLRGIERQHWLATALQRTLWPFVITAVLAGLAGLVMQHYHPEAHSLGAVLHGASARD